MVNGKKMLVAVRGCRWRACPKAAVAAGLCHAHYKAKRRAMNPEKHAAQARAHSATQSALLRGEIVRPKACPRCGRGVQIEAHHEDYSKPLEIEWLCRGCHLSLHGKRRAKK